MPLYQYKCNVCSYELEARQKFSDDPLQECPNCGAPTGLFRVVQAAGIVFKGSGFYITDSKGSRDSLTSTSKKNGESAGGGDAPSGDKSDKGADKSEASPSKGETSKSESKSTSSASPAAD